VLPLKDLNRSSTTPYVNHLLLVANITVFVVYSLSASNILLDPRFSTIVEQEFVMVPSEIIQGMHLYTILTSMFMHAGLLHIFGNMLYLFVFGDNVEDVFGHVGYLGFYLLCGIVAAFAHIASVLGTPDLYLGVVGASGAISGVLGAYVVLFPKAKVLTLVTYLIIPIPAIAFIGFWFVLQWLSVYLDASGGVAYWAHIGGFIAGAVLALAIGLALKKKRDARLRL
jgi:membrane associated rhomboid family serine protease